eukprot:maker-scaffold_4-snap-gene-19.5-mRNA-1 protein AED:0.01 eAED:0.01 QI:123/1/1/1/1/1/2/436/238
MFSTDIPSTSISHDFVFKIVLIGDTSVGKTNLLSRYASNSFNVANKSTIGVEFSSKTELYDSKNLKAQIWDTAGQERFQALAKAYYRGAYGAIIVYDMTKRSSFDNLNKWVSYLQENSERPNIKITIVGNKVDLAHLRSVSEQEGREYALGVNAEFFECSAYDATNVNDAFRSLVLRIYAQVQSSSKLLSLDLGKSNSFKIIDGEKVDVGGKKSHRNGRRSRKSKRRRDPKIVCCPTQ